MGRKKICILKYILKHFYLFKIYFKKAGDFKIYFDLQIFSKYILNLFFSVYEINNIKINLPSFQLDVRKSSQSLLN